MLPFPAMERRVSGRKRAIRTRQAATIMTILQKIDRQPSPWERAPPIAGAIHGASIGPRLNMPKYPPLSLLVEISPITPAPRAIVLALPPDWKHRKKRRSQN
jgi:hypothetical protein